MRCKKAISAEVKQDIKQNALWYYTRQKGLGIQFTTQIRKTINYIADFPLAFPEKYADIRVAVVDVFPYTLHYYYDQLLNTIFVTCIFHDANDPEILKNRLSF